MPRGALRIASVALVLVCLLWMDFCLYCHIQTISRPHLNGTLLSAEDNHATIRNNNNNNHNNKLNSKQANEAIASRISSRLSSFNANIDDDRPPIDLSRKHYHENNRHHDYTTNSSLLLAPVRLFSFAFEGLSVKLMMTDPVDNYLLGPLAVSFGLWCDFRHRFHFVSANMVSVAGLLSALVAAKLVARQASPNSHRLAFVFFQLRNWLDDLDGVVARSRLGITHHVSLQNTFGYLVDGLCDAVGFVAIVWATYLYLKRSHYITYRQVKAAPADRPNHSRLRLLIGLFLVQLVLASAAWNKYILKYSSLLERPSANEHASASQLKILKSNIMFVLVWFWRLTSGHSWMQFLAVSILMGHTWRFLEFIKFIGLIEILILVAMTQLHTIDISEYLRS